MKPSLMAWASDTCPSSIHTKRLERMSDATSERLKTFTCWQRMRPVCKFIGLSYCDDFTAGGQWKRDLSATQREWFGGLGMLVTTVGEVCSMTKQHGHQGELNLQNQTDRLQHAFPSMCNQAELYLQICLLSTRLVGQNRFFQRQKSVGGKTKNQSQRSMAVCGFLLLL